MKKKSYEQKYQNHYYKSVTKEKRREKALKKKEEIEKLKEFLQTNTRTITHTCPICNCTWDEETHSTKTYKSKVCPSCKRTKNNNYNKLTHVRLKNNARNRERYKNNPEVHDRITKRNLEYQKKRKEMLKKQKEENITLIPYLHKCPTCKSEWVETIPSNTTSHTTKTCPTCKSNKLNKVKKKRGRKPNTLKAEFTAKRVILKKKSNSKNSVKV